MTKCDSLVFNPVIGSLPVFYLPDDLPGLVISPHCLYNNGIKIPSLPSVPNVSMDERSINYYFSQFPSIKNFNQKTTWPEKLPKDQVRKTYDLPLKIDKTIGLSDENYPSSPIDLGDNSTELSIHALLHYVQKKLSKNISPSESSSLSSTEGSSAEMDCILDEKVLDLGPEITIESTVNNLPEESSTQELSSSPVNNVLKWRDEPNQPPRTKFIYRKYDRRRRNKHRKFKGRQLFSGVKERIDPGGIRVRYENNVFYSTIGQVNWKVTRPQRAGVIVYTKTDQLYFCLGIDYDYGNLTDFGGHVSPTDGDSLAGGLREFEEETHQIFGPVKVEDLNNYQVAYRHDMMIMFLPLKVNPQMAMENFKQAAACATDREIGQIIWLNQAELMQAIQTGQVQIKQRIIRVYNEVLEFLRQLLEAEPNFIQQLP